MATAVVVMEMVYANDCLWDFNHTLELCLVRFFSRFEGVQA